MFGTLVMLRSAEQEAKHYSLLYYHGTFLLFENTRKYINITAKNGGFQTLEFPQYTHSVP